METLKVAGAILLILILLGTSYVGLLVLAFRGKI